MIRDSLEAALAAGEYPAGTPLPSEAKLAARFGCAIGTVRRAVDELVAARALVRRQGRGTFVPDHDAMARLPHDGPDRTAFYFFHIRPEDGARLPPETELLDFRAGLPCPAWIAPHLGIAARAPMIFARNLQRIGGRAVALDELWLPRALFPGLDRAGFAGRDGTVYGLYQKRFGHSVIRTDERLKAVPAPAEAATAFDLAPGAPVLRILRVAYAIGDRPVELRISHADTREHEYFNTLA
ncbi:GntR family transcriptional regulator [Roseomonas sp. HF4]|uniref:GntR family transcriptional regulator n=1 Tax=Roseomonas sp. HF4 TaxID=2562313 RepID=UPI00148563EF|nr:GntR family transcriptional regulator [Roseomonas sp. HF4]